MFPSKALWDVVSKPFKRSQLGLFQGKTKLSGNNVPFSKHKTRRTWLPNVQQKRVESKVLGEKIRLKVTTRALRTIKKVRKTYICFSNYSRSLQKGGLDNYLKSTPSELLGYTGMQLRMRVRAKQLETRGLRRKEFKLINSSNSQPLVATPLSEYRRKQEVVVKNAKPSLLTPAGIQALREFVGRSLGKEKPAT
jgi:large subunit ribosomal protein L28